MKINQIISEMTVAGAIAPVSHSFTKMETRNPSVYGDQKVGNLLKGKKTNKKFANSVNEGKDERSQNALWAQITDYEKRAKATKNDTKRDHYTKMANDLRLKLKTRDEVTEAELSEDDIILIPGQGQRLKPGFHQHDPDKAEHEGETLKNSLHTIIRVATHLNRELSTRDNFPEWVSEKIGAVKSNIVNVMDYLISQKEMGQHTDGMYEGAKGDRMVKHIEKSEKKLGKSSEEAENIAWATANKRGYLDNKNKKKH